MILIFAFHKIEACCLAAPHGAFLFWRRYAPPPDFGVKLAGLVISRKVLTSPNLAKFTMKNDFYTYAWLREDGTPYYIGKGRNGRANRKDRRFYPGDDRVLILKKNLTEGEAFRHECYMIAVFGRKDLGTGILRNRTNGGEGTSGKVIIYTDEWRERQSKAHQGKELSEETKEKIRQAHLGKPKTNSHRIGTKHSEETKEKIRQKALGRKHSEETKELLRQQNTGRKIHLSDEARERRSEGQRRRWARERETALYGE
jgi:hypothetical protein